MHLLLPYFIILIVVIQLKLRKNSKKNEQSDKNYWEREREANTVRRKNIDNLDYIIIPEHMLFDDISYPDTDYSRNKSTMIDLRHKKILNLTGLNNTDLKMEYGPGNLATLIEYDDNYSTLARTIIVLAKSLMDNGYTDAAVELLELGIESHTDISANYLILADYYKSNGQADRIERLRTVAGGLRSMNKDIILSKLQ